MKTALALASIIVMGSTQDCLAAPQPASKTTRSVVLKQTHYFFGRLALMASNVGVRVDSEGSWKFILVAKAPDWKIYVFRNDDKVCHETSLKQFEDTGLVSQYMLGARDPEVAGREQQLHEMVGDIHLKRRANPSGVCDYMPLSNVVAPQCRDIIFSMYRIPHCGGIPLNCRKRNTGKDWMTGVDQTGKWNADLTTTAASIQNVDTKQFDPPQHYKMVASMTQVITSKVARDSSGSGADELLRQ